MPSAAAVATRSPRSSHPLRRRLWAWDVAGRSSTGSRSSAIVDLVSAGSEDVPLGAELVEPLPVGGAGLGVAGVTVERVAVVGDLGSAVAAVQDAQLSGQCATAGLGGAGGGERRPPAGAGVVAGGSGGRVGFEQVQGTGAAVPEDLTQPGLGGRHGGRCCPVAGWCGGGRGAAVATGGGAAVATGGGAAAAGSDGESDAGGQDDAG